MRFRDGLAWATLVASVGITLFIGVDRWIVMAWTFVLIVLAVLFILGRLLLREIRGDIERGPVDPRRRIMWVASGLAAFLSCTLAAGLVRSGEGLLMDYWLLGVLMVSSVVLARLAYHDKHWGVHHNR